MKNKSFIKGVERLVDPIEVGTIHFFQFFTKMMPLRLQKRFMKTSERKAPYMGFVVEPYSLFLCFEIIDIGRVEEMLPDRFELIKSKIHEKDSSKYYGIIGSFNAHTSGFWGARQETYIIAKDKKTGLTTWIIIGIETNTISYEPKKGLQDPNAKNSVITQDTEGDIIVDIRTVDELKILELTCKTKNGKWVHLDQKVWLEGNLSIAYGKNLGEKESKPFSLVFDPKEVEKGMHIPLKDLEIHKNTIARDIFEENPTQVIMFPYSQHFVSDSPTSPKTIKNRKELVQKHKELGDLSEYQVFSAKTMKIGLAIAIFVSSMTSMVLSVILLYHLIIVN